MSDLIETGAGAFVFTNRMALSIPGDTMYEVSYYTDTTPLTDDMEETAAFLKGDYVYIYRGSSEGIPKDERECGLYVTPKGKRLFVKPKTDYEKDVYHVSNVVEIDPQSFLRKIKENLPQLITKEDMERVNNSANILKVPIEDNDDFLKRAIKEVVNEKNVSLKAYESRTDKDKPYHISNLRSALTKKNQKMSTSRFQEWVELMDLDWTLEIRDADPNSAFAPLSKPIRISRSDLE